MFLIYFAWSEKNSLNTKTVKLDVTRKIGRDATSDILVNDRQVSGTQAEVYDQSGTVTLKNVSATNDIIVNGSVIAKNGGTASLTPSTTMEMGKTSFTVQLASVADGTETFKNCSWCSKPIPESSTKCIWCGRDQDSASIARITML